MITDITEIRAFEVLIEDSKKKPVLLLKHSTTCPCSAKAWAVFLEFQKEHTDLSCNRVLVRENSEVALKIAEMIDLEHESPQLILLYKGVLAWSNSHFGITLGSITEAVDSILPE
jgi:monothiol bacilliredoxin